MDVLNLTWQALLTQAIGMRAPPVAARPVGGSRVSVEMLWVEMAVSARRARVVGGAPAATPSMATARAPTTSRRRARYGKGLILAIVTIRAAGDGRGAETRNSSGRGESASRASGPAARGSWVWLRIQLRPDL